MTNDEIKKLIKKIDKLYSKSTGGKWSVWDGPEYFFGGRDLCIGAGDDWLANMDERHCINYDEHNQKALELDMKKCEYGVADICSLSPSRITKEQRHTADLIVALHNNWPEIRELLKSML
jgi:hypothetical protein